MIANSFMRIGFLYATSNLCMYYIDVKTVLPARMRSKKKAVLFVSSKQRSL